MPGHCNQTLPLPPIQSPSLQTQGSAAASGPLELVLPKPHRKVVLEPRTVATPSEVWGTLQRQYEDTETDHICKYECEKNHAVTLENVFVAIFEAQLTQRSLSN